ncbi:MAG: nucleotidyl transferase AbiEii/AbiGii toxin family protein [Solirubrobacterales bacterium]
MTGFGQILEDLNEAGVEYVLVGGIAMIRHGVVRATRDIDAVFEPTEENVARIRALIGRWKATSNASTASPLPSAPLLTSWC